MPIARDPRYDILFVDTDQAGNEIERLPLMLREGGGGLDFNIAYTSPFAGRLPNNDVQDNDNTRYNVRTQRDWRGGIGQEFAYQETNKFSASLADTRFRNQLMLPPKPQGTTISGSGDPQFTPAQSGVSVTTRQAKAEWVKGARVDANGANTSAQWAAQGVSNATSNASGQWSARTLGYGSNGYTVVQISGSGRTRVAMSFNTGNANTLNSVTFRIGTSNIAGQLYAAIQADSGGAPSGTDLASFGVFTGYPSFPTDQSPIDWVATFSGGVALSANTTYWIVLRVQTGNPLVSIYGNTSSLTGTCKEYIGSWGGATGYNFYASLSLSTGNYDKTQTRISQRIYAVASVSVTQIKIPISASAWTGSPTLAAKLCADSGGAISTVLQSATVGNPGGSIVWVTFTIPSQAIATGTYYWIVLEADAPTTSDAITVSWLRDANGNYPSGAGYYQTSTNGGAWSGYTAVGGAFYFTLNTGYAGNFPFFDGNVVTRYRNEQSFTGDGNSYTSVQLYVQRGMWTGSPTFTVSIYADSGGAPAASALRTVSMSDPGASWTWVTAAFSALTLTNAATYWLVIESNAPTTSDAVRVYWQKDTSQGYAGGSGNYQSVSNYNAWSGLASEGGDFYFFFGTLGATWLGYYAYDQVRVQQAQQITPSATVALTKLRFYAQQVSRAGNGAVSVGIYANSGGAPGAVIVYAMLGSAAFNATQLAWVEAALTATMTGGTSYWMVIDCDAPAVGDSVYINVGCDSNNVLSGVPNKQRTITNFSAGAWSADQGSDLFYILNNGVAAPAPVTCQPALFNGAWYMASDTGVYRFAEVLNSNTSFENSLTGWTLTQNGTSSTSYSTAEATKERYSLKITRNGGTYCNLDGTQVTAAAGQVFAASVWVKALTNTTGTPVRVYVYFQDAVNAFLGNVYVDAVTGGEWQLLQVTGTAPASTAKVYLSIQMQSAQGVLVDDARLTRNEWVLKYNAASRVTALQPFAGKLYAALGDSDDMAESADGNTWTATTGSRRYTFLRAFGGYLYCMKATGGVNALAYSDGTTWVTNLTVATADQSMTGLAGFNNELIVLGARSMFSLSSAFVYQIFDYANEEDADNGRNALVWMVDGRLYVPVRNGLNAYDGVKMDAVGPDQDEGLPAGEQGRIAAMCGSKTWLFASVDGGANGMSGIYAYNGSGWHCLAKATTTGRRIRAVGIETVTSPRGYARLWWFEDSTPYYVEFPNVADNPYQFAGVRFAGSGFVTSSWFGGELALIQKDFNAIAVWSDGCSANQTVQVYYEVDQSGIWNLAGTVTVSPYQEFTLGAPTMANKTAGTGCTTTTINLGSGLTTDMATGRFVRIGAQVAQVKTIVSATQFTLALPLPAAPAAGTNIVTSGPAGRQIRYRLVLNTTDETKTPKVNRVSIRTMGAVLAKARITLSPRIEDGMRLRTGADQYPLTAAALRTKLYEWVRRSKPFIMVDMFGQNWAVKITGQSESVPVRQDDQTKGAMTYRSSMRLEMDEV